MSDKTPRYCIHVFGRGMYLDSVKQNTLMIGDYRLHRIVRGRLDVNYWEVDMGDGVRAKAHLTNRACPPRWSEQRGETVW